ncbi:MAG: RNA methyltransferase [Gammaproteobacteria bacterium]
MKLDDVCIVLVGTTHPGNIGATARAMKTMGLSDLRIVTPRHFPHPDATARASGSDDVLDAATVHATLDEALTGTMRVFGASARLRSLPWPVHNPRETAETVRQMPDGQKAALVFGREKTGLTNDELERCHALVNIDTNPEFGSLNLAMAVQVLAYEVRGALVAPRDTTPEEPEARPATQDEMRFFYDHLERVMLRSGFLNPANPRHLVRRIKRLFNRASPDHNEVNILRGLLSAVEEFIGEGRPRSG